MTCRTCPRKVSRQLLRLVLLALCMVASIPFHAALHPGAPRSAHLAG